MINLIKADFYKLIRSVSFYVNAILSVLMAISGVYLVYFSTQGIPAEYLGLNGISVMGYTMAFMSSFSLLSLFCTIFLSLFISNEFSFGTVKNILSSGQSRFSLYFSKIFISLFVVFVYTTLCSIFSLILASYFWGIGDIPRDEYLNLFRMIGLNIVVEFSIQCIFAMVCFLVRRGGISLAINLIILMCTRPVIIPFISGIFEKITKKQFDFDKYWPQTYSGKFSALSIESKDIVTGLIVCGMAILISSLIGFVIFANRDID